MNVVGFREVVMVLPVYAGHCDQIAAVWSGYSTGWGKKWESRANPWKV